MQRQTSDRLPPGPAPPRAATGDGLWGLGTLPVTCAVVTALNGLIMVLVAIGNLTDYDANYAFVHHVLAMDTTNFGEPPGRDLDPDIMWRAITSPTLQSGAYLLIIAWECMTALVLVVATLFWPRALRLRHYAGARRWSAVGLLMIMILFVGGFLAVGGEWFAMWRSEDWDGTDAAFRYAVLALLGLLLLHLPTGWEPAEPMRC